MEEKLNEYKNELNEYKNELDRLNNKYSQKMQELSKESILRKKRTRTKNREFRKRE